MRLRLRIQIRPTASGLDRLAPLVAQGDGEAADRPPDRALPDLTGGRVEGRQADLGHSIPLDDREPRLGGELGQQLGRDLVGARRGRSEARRSRRGCRSWSWISAESAAGIIASIVG